MAANTRREKVRFQARKAIAALDDALLHLQKTTEIAQGQSPFIDQKIPELVQVVVAVQDLFRKYYEQL